MRLLLFILAIFAKIGVFTCEYPVFFCSKRRRYDKNAKLQSKSNVLLAISADFWRIFSVKSSKIARNSGFK